MPKRTHDDQSVVIPKLPGREKQMEALQGFIRDCSCNKISGSMYVAGPPGCGKTASIKLLTAQKWVMDDFKIVYINCMSAEGSIYKNIVEKLGLKTKARSDRECAKHVEKFICQGNPILMILDEIQELENMKQSILYKIFEWPVLTNSRLVLIGMANALDLTNRSLPRLQTNLAFKPKLLLYPAYNKEQLVRIIVNKLEKIEKENVIFPESAIQLLAGKVAAMSGDARRALDLTQRVFDVSPKDEITAQKRIKVTDVLGVISDIYNTTQKLDAVGSEDGFPLQQKIIVCSLLKLIKYQQKGKQHITVSKMHQAYKKICFDRNICSLDISEFLSTCSLLHMRGVFKIQGKNYDISSKVILQWDEREITAIFNDKTLLADILG